jgi:hypothetical protein
MGLQSGIIVNFFIEIESLGFLQEDEDEKQFEKQNPKENVLKLDQKLITNPDNLLFQYYYIQSEDDTPFLDVRDIPV